MKHPSHLDPYLIPYVHFVDTDAGFEVKDLEGKPAWAQPAH